MFYYVCDVLTSFILFNKTLNKYDTYERLKKEGFTFISEEPKEGADNKLVVFLHPKCTNGVLVELCQEKP